MNTANNNDAIQNHQSNGCDSPLPTDILIVKKHLADEVTRQFLEVASWLLDEKCVRVYAEASVTSDEHINDGTDTAADTMKRLYTLTNENKREIDLIVSLGGDGTILHISGMFQEQCPPVLSFHAGSLGFLTPFSFRHFRKDIDSVFNGELSMTERTRLKARVTRASSVDDESVETVLHEYVVLNEVIIDRGGCSSVCHLDIACNGRHLTTLVGDGLAISTPTGSTAYATAAGASMVQPGVAAILVTPICPHSLSFRPIVLPPNIELTIKVSDDRKTKSAQVFFDGRNSIAIDEHMHVSVTSAKYTVPCYAHQDGLSDWFNGLAECLHWNNREEKRKKSFKRHPNKKLGKYQS